MLKDDSRREIIAIAQEILSKRMDVVEGLRAINSLASHAEIDELDMFVTCIRLVDDTDYFPREEVLKNFAESYLAQLDREKSDYLRECSEEIQTFCKDLIALLTPMLPNDEDAY